MIPPDSTPRAPSPPKPKTPAQQIADLEKAKRREERSLADARTSSLGQIGRYERRELEEPLAAGGAGLVTWTPQRGGSATRFHTTVRVWCETGAPDGSEISCALDGISEGRDRGKIHDHAEAGSLATFDVGRTTVGQLATFGFSWTAPEGDPPDPITFFVEIISTPL